MLSYLSRSIDAIAEAVSPQWAARRASWRNYRAVQERQAERFKRGYEGAERDPARGQNWLASKLSPESDIERDLTDLRERAGDLARNNEWASSAIESRVANVIGTGMRPQSRIQSEDKQRDVWNKELEQSFARWSSCCSDDASDFAEFEGLVERCVARDGEAIVLIVNEAHTDDSPIPLRLQLIDVARLETPPAMSGNSLVRLGVERDKTGRRVALHIRDTHPGDTQNNTATYTRVPFWENGERRILHVFDPKYASQSRGVTWLSPVIGRLKDLHDFAEAELINNQVAACFSAFIKTGGSSPHSVRDASSTSTDTHGTRFQNLNPGTISYLGKDEEITVASPTRPSGTFAPYMEWQLLSVAAGLNWPFAWLVKDYRRSSFSSGRLGEIDGGCHVRMRQHSLGSQLLGPVWRRFVAEAVLAGECSIDPGKFASDRWSFTHHAWIAPGRPWIDPVKEVTAIGEALDRGLTTHSSELAARGRDFEEWLAEKLAEDAALKAAGIVLGPQIPAPIPTEPADPEEGDPEDPEQPDPEEDQLARRLLKLFRQRRVRAAESAKV